MRGISIWRTPSLLSRTYSMYEVTMTSLLKHSRHTSLDDQNFEIWNLGKTSGDWTSTSTGSYDDVVINRRLQLGRTGIHRRQGGPHDGGEEDPLEDTLKLHDGNGSTRTKQIYTWAPGL